MSDTPETDIYIKAAWGDGFAAKTLAEPMRRLERERDEARAEAARLQMELDASCNAEELRQVREENARLREAINQAHEALDTCVQFIQDAHIIEAQWDWEPVEQSKKAIEAITKLNITP